MALGRQTTLGQRASIYMQLACRSAIVSEIASPLLITTGSGKDEALISPAKRQRQLRVDGEPEKRQMAAQLVLTAEILIYYDDPSCHALNCLLSFFLSGPNRRLYTASMKAVILCSSRVKLRPTRCALL